MKQASFASLAFDQKKKQTRRERFLLEMETVIPWAELLEVIEPHYPKSGQRGRQPMGLETMLRIYFLQQWYALSDPGMEDALYEIESMRRFAKLDLFDDALPDETTILHFRHLLERHELGNPIIGSSGKSGKRRNNKRIQIGTRLFVPVIFRMNSTNFLNFSIFTL
jgi:hypothetical protein